MRKFGPRPADHPFVGPCPICKVAFKAGDFTTLVEVGPADAEEAKKKAERLAYTAEAKEIHWDCQNWMESDGTLIADRAELEYMGLINGAGIVTLPGEKGIFDLKKAHVDKAQFADDIAGWRFEVKGQKYLVIND